jgi:hypothetical protein
MARRDARAVRMFSRNGYNFGEHDRATVLCAFDLIELDGRNLRKAPIEQRKDLQLRLYVPVLVLVPERSVFASQDL